MSLYHLREVTKMTQTEIANKLGISQPSYGQWERGESLPTVDRLPAIASVLGVSIETVVNALLSKEEKTA